MVAVPTGEPTGCPVSPPLLFPQNKLSNEESPESHRAQGVPPIMSPTLSANRESNERVMGKASRIQRSRMGSMLVCVGRNAQHRELKLLESTRFALNNILMVAGYACGPTGVSPPPLSSQNIQSHEKSPTSHRVRGETKATSLALGTNPEGKERVKGKVSRMQSSRIGSALVCVRRNAQHLELKLSESTRFVLNTVGMVALSTCGSTDCPVSPPPLSSQNIQSHEKSPTSHWVRGEAKTTSLALGANPEGKERVKGKASRMHSSRMGSMVVCVRRNAQHHELIFLESKRFVLNAVVIVSTSTCGPTGCPVSPPPLLSQNIQSHEKSHTNHRARGETPTISLALGTNREGRESQG